MCKYNLFLPLFSLLLASQFLTAAPEDSLAFARTPQTLKSITVDHMAYSLSWNSDFNVPNWVAYCLTRQEVETKAVKRSDKFCPDPDVTNSPGPEDYKRSGYDRGHIAPAADMRWNLTAMRECFYMTNMCPQLHSLNAGSWGKLEDHARELALRYDSLYICAGPVIDPADNNLRYIGSKHSVLVPKQFFKAFLVQIDGRWHAIVYLFSAEGKSADVRTETIDFFENMSGLDLFYNLPDNIELEVESTLNNEIWK